MEKVAHSTNMKWGDRPYELDGKGRRWGGNMHECPVCWLVRGDRVRLRLDGRRHPMDDRPVYCPACHRRWESLRWFLYGWCPYWVPRIEQELHAASGVDERNSAWREEQEANLWRREQEVRQAVEAGTWTPGIRDDLQPPRPEEMEHFDPKKHTPNWARTDRTLDW